MPRPEIDEFARILVQRVRDNAIRNCRVGLMPGSNSPIARRWRDLGVVDDAINVVIADCVDETLFALLNAIDQGVLRLKFVSGTGDVVDLEQDGQAELGGWFVGDDGWRALYAEEPYADDAADERND